MRATPGIRNIVVYHLIAAMALSVIGVVLIDNVFIRKAIKKNLEKIRQTEFSRSKNKLKSKLWLISNFIHTQRLYGKSPLSVLRKQLKELIRHSRFADGEDVFAGTGNGKLLPFSYHKQRRPLLTGFLTKKTIDRDLRPARDSCIFLTYDIQLTPEAKKEKKISYIKWFPSLNLFIGTGVLISNIEKNISKKSGPIIHQQQLFRSLLWLILITITLVTDLLLFLFNRKIIQDCRLLQDYLRKVNMKMQPINTQKLKYRELKALAMDTNWMTRKLRRFTLNLEKMLDEKGLLLKEIHHRVKNNFQLVSSIIGIQSTHIKDPDLIRILDKCTHRIRSIALAHEKIYNSTDFTSVNFEEYASTLMLMLTQSHPEHAGRVLYDIGETPLPLPLEKAIPCALILNELAENAFQHAFKHQTTGNIRVSFLVMKTERRSCITISDTGWGLPEGVDPHGADSLGFTLIRLLVSQLRGEMTISREKGTTIAVCFPE